MDARRNRRNTLVKVNLYIEGGGNSNSLRTACREGFINLFQKAGFKGRMPKAIACGSRDDAYDSFKTALRNADTDTYPILLVDSEEAVSTDAWNHLINRDNWVKPNNAEDQQAQLMVQCMETWCIADRKTLRQFFGNELQESALLPIDNLENRDKTQVQDALVHATRNCGKDRVYKKGKRSFELLGHLDPTVLKDKLLHFKRLCDTLDKIIDTPPAGNR